MLTFVRFESPEKIAHKELRARASNRASGRHTRHFVVHDNREEVAWVSLDFYPVPEALSIYEIFVPSNVRSQGIGDRVLREVEKMAKAEGYGKVRLGARPMEAYPKARLEDWYKKRGYEHPPDSLGDVLEKTLE